MKEFKNEAEQSNVVSAKMLSTYSAKEFTRFDILFYQNEHPELTYQEIDAQREAIEIERRRRKTVRRKKRLPWWICALVAFGCMVFFKNSSADVPALLFAVAGLALIVVALLQKAGAAEDDDE